MSTTHNTDAHPSRVCLVFVISHKWKVLFGLISSHFPSSQIIGLRDEKAALFKPRRYVVPICRSAQSVSQSLHMEEINTVRRVTFQEAQEGQEAPWTGWENPFQDGSDLVSEADEILSLWRLGALHQYKGGHSDHEQPQDLPVMEADIKQRGNKEEKSNRLFQKILKWKVKLTQNFLKVR